MGFVAADLDDTAFQRFNATSSVQSAVWLAALAKSRQTRPEALRILKHMGKIGIELVKW
jgi:hypothetical protein